MFKREQSFKRIREIVKQSGVVSDFHSIFPDFQKVAYPKKWIISDNRKRKKNIENTCKSESNYPRRKFL